MGYYINPNTESKEAFLDRVGMEVPPTFKWDQRPQGRLPVVLINNGPFTAAGVAYSEDEFKVMTNPDGRSKTIFIVSIDEILKVVDDPDILSRRLKDDGLLNSEPANA